MSRAYYRNTIQQFLLEPDEQILGTLLSKHKHQQLDIQQKNAWQRQIEILKQHLLGLTGYVYFEFSIPRMGRRVDNILILGNQICLLEFKIGSEQYDKHSIDQVIDYALDLHHFHEGSHHRCLTPILIAEHAAEVPNSLEAARNFQTAIKLNAHNLRAFLNTIHNHQAFDVFQWEHSCYKPTPTIIEAAQALYQNHDVKEITRSDASAENLSQTAKAIKQIIEQSKKYQRKSICFITGVPGAGKTLAGLNIANQRLHTADDEHAVFLSGNGPLVAVLQEALAREVKHKSKTKALKDAKTFIQNIHHFRDEYLVNSQAPTEKVVIFDEAQRAWNQTQASKFMKKRGYLDFNQSEPEFLVNIMNRHEHWCSIICLIGGGQEINTGEAGLQEWLRALQQHHQDWQIYYSNLIIQDEIYLHDETLKTWLTQTGQAVVHLHLATSIRSFRSEKVAAFIQALLNQSPSAKMLYQEISAHYPIVLTRDLYTAKSWLKQQAKGRERFGMTASSGARRLKAFGINVKNEIDVAQWFLNPKEDVRSSYFLEDVATEFDVQGLELDWTCVGWDGDFHIHENQFKCQEFKGSRWQNVNQTDKQNHILNAYRVLLTRARQGFVIWIPEGSETDTTRKPTFYDGTYQYLKSIGIIELQKI